jgi:hypothetical protein
MTRLLRSPERFRRVSTTPGGATYTHLWAVTELRKAVNVRSKSLSGTPFQGAASFVPTDTTTTSC